MREDDLLARVKDLAERMNWLLYHTHRSQFSPAGFPDCTMVRGDRIVFAELKVGKYQPTAEQAEWLEALHDTGAEVYLWRETEEDWQEMTEVLR